MPVMDEYEYLENASVLDEPIVRLINWASNEDRPYTYWLFLDLIGWSEDNLAQNLYDLENNRPGFLELSYLADALQVYSTRPNDVREFVDGYERAVMDHA